MQFDLLRYSDTVLDVCTHGWTRRQLHDLIRQVAVYPSRIRVCSCTTTPWVVECLSFLKAQKQQCTHTS